MKPGDQVTWMAVNGPKTGVIEKKRGEGYLIRLPNQKCVIAHKKSLKQWNET